MVDVKVRSVAAKNTHTFRSRAKRKYLRSNQLAKLNQSFTVVCCLSPDSPPQVLVSALPATRPSEISLRDHVRHPLQIELTILTKIIGFLAGTDESLFFVDFYIRQAYFSIYLFLYFYFFIFLKNQGMKSTADGFKNGQKG